MRTSDQRPPWVDAVTWVRRPTVDLPDGVLNLCYNALDRQVIHGRADQVAVLFPSGPGAGTSLSYAELLDRVGRFGGVLRACGVGPGDVVLVVLPAVPEAVVAMLACARIGAVHVVAPAATTTAELRDRLRRWRPTVVLGADSTILAAALDEPGTHRPAVCIMLGGTSGDPVGERLVDWSVVMREGAVPPAGCVPLAGSHPWCVGPQQTVLTTAVAAVLAWAGRHHDAVRPGRPWTPDPSVDWARGHVWQVYAPLVAGATAHLRDEATGRPPSGRPDWSALCRDAPASLEDSPGG